MTHVAAAREIETFTGQYVNVEDPRHNDGVTDDADRVRTGPGRTRGER